MRENGNRVNRPRIKSRKATQEMSMTMGGQTRTAMMPCGKLIMADPRTVKTRILIHKKVCGMCADVIYTDTPFQPNGNDRANITFSRNGNITKTIHREVKAMCDGEIHPLLVKANTTEKSLTIMKEVKEMTESK